MKRRLLIPWNEPRHVCPELSFVGRKSATTLGTVGTCCPGSFAKVKGGKRALMPFYVKAMANNKLVTGERTSALPG